MTLPHPERHRWVKVISSINKKINERAEAAQAAVVAKRPKPVTAPPRMGAGGIHWVNPDEMD